MNIWIAPNFAIDEEELQWDFVHANGPGGQNVNKVSSAVQLRLNVLQNEAIPPEVKGRLRRLAGKRINANGELIIQAHRYRTQEQNRREALQRLAALLQKAAQKPKARYPTQPSPAARQERLNAKRRRSQLKALRQKWDWEIE
ncbi:MAG: aminoacyl-tRNA hydrolase [Anaerolineae bacterium]|jgi:ribosome-associated protein|nr:MAG: aminoacyl-tRNA hydrolase [Anaerolineae bacterium]